MKSTKPTKFNLKLTNSDFSFNRSWKLESSAKRWFEKNFGQTYFLHNPVRYKTSKTSYSKPIHTLACTVWELLKTHKFLQVSDLNSWESFLTLKIS